MRDGSLFHTFVTLSRIPGSGNYRHGDGADGRSWQKNVKRLLSAKKERFLGTKNRRLCTSTLYKSLPICYSFLARKKNSTRAGSPATNVNLDTETAISATDTNDTVGTAIPAVFFFVHPYSVQGAAAFRTGYGTAGEAAPPWAGPCPSPRPVYGLGGHERAFGIFSRHHHSTRCTSLSTPWGKFFKSAGNPCIIWACSISLFEKVHFLFAFFKMIIY